ncbi:Uncharacterised protein [uncultured archaeon]|nr:Uncharacterised protein [uncultured archaeon]
MGIKVKIEDILIVSHRGIVIMNKIGKIYCTLLILTTLVIPTSATLQPLKHVTSITSLNEDFDPLDEHIFVTVTINEIRALKTIDTNSNPNFYLKVTINGEEFISDVWQDMMYVENPNWTVSSEVPKNNEFVNVTIALWDKRDGGDVLCDLSPGNGDGTQARTAEMTYSIATGIWFGDDYLKDPSGYGRLSGIDDGSIYEQDADCELWFTISQNDFDGDGFPYWLEVNMYNTSPLVNNRGEDTDGDGVPIEWEYTFGVGYSEEGSEVGYYMLYNPFVWENHTALDSDKDGLSNIEEFKTWQWGSDPFRQDIFIELDVMEAGPNGEGGSVPSEAFDLLRDSYARHNIVWHIDDGRLGGGEFIPFKATTANSDYSLWYWEYFMHGDAHNWRRGVFRWCIAAYDYTWAEGFTFGSQINSTFALDAFFISTKYHDYRAKISPLLDGMDRKISDKEMNRVYVYAGAIMHETGHTLDIRAPGCDARHTVWPWEINYWRYASYKSVMNYRYIYRGVVDYSDGSHGENDYDDWSNLDLTRINPGGHW